MKFDRNILSVLRMAFSLCARVSWCDVRTDFTNVIKVVVDVNKMSQYLFNYILLSTHRTRTRLL